MAKRGFKGSGGMSGDAAGAQSLLQQAVNQFNAGHVAEAERTAQDVLALQPRNGAALNLLGGIALKAERFEDAAAFLKRARQDQPRNPFIRFNLAEALRRAKSFSAAVPHYKGAIEIKPDFAEAHAQLGETLRALGKSTQAAYAYRSALGLNPNLSVALNGLGLLAQQEGNEAQAARHFEVAVRCPPLGMVDSPGAIWANLGVARMRLGLVPSALEAMIEAVTREPDNAEIWRLLSTSLGNVAVVPADPRFRDVLLALFARDDINPRNLASAAVLTLLRDPETAEALDAFARAQQAQDGAPFAPRASRLDALLADPLLLALLANAPIPHAGLELLLTAVRRDLLLSIGEQNGALDLSFMCALARQCFLNEYIYFIGDAENKPLAGLLALLDRDGFGADPCDWLKLALIASYMPLHETRATVLDLSGAPDSLRAVIREQIEEPRQERELAKCIERLKPIEDGVSLAVQEQYEQNPYPRWTRPQIGAPLPLRAAMRLRLPEIDERLIAEVDAPRILIAGSGTGLQTARVLGSYKNASVLAVDLSAASLAYDMRKLAERGITSVRHLQGDILDLERLDERFDIIESFGVIHHMRAPAEGLRILASLLKPRGLLFLGLYSEIARSSVIAARALIAERGYPATIDGIRQARREIMTGGGAPELQALLSPASDFWTASDCRDLIFHVEEHRFTLNEIDALFAQTGLTFLGIETRTAADRLRFIAETPDPAALASLSAWHGFETRHPEAFGETYRLWAQRA